MRPNIRIVLAGLMTAMMLAMLDNMIVSTALPRIVGEFGGLNHFTWVVTAYVLGTTVSTPIWGKLGDLYGRKGVFLTSIGIFLVGSALCGMAGSAMLGGPADGMVELIAFRAIQGLGAGGLMVGVMAIIGDLVPPRERGRYQGMIAGIMAIAMVAGPLVGGFITDNLSWRWAFYVNLPLGGLALIVLATQMHLPKYRTEHRIDWLGAALLSVGITALVLITTWGGSEYAWTSTQIIGLAVVVVATLTAFAFVERRAPEPILPLHLFTNRNFALISAIGFLLGFAMFGAMNFLPLFQQTVQGASATNSGLLLLPLMAGMLVVSVISGRVITKTGRYRIFPIIGGVALIAGMLLLTMLDANTSKTDARALHDRARRRHGLPDADLDADRAEQRRAEGPGRRQRRGDVLPVDRRLASASRCSVRCSCTGWPTPRRAPSSAAAIRQGRASTRPCCSSCRCRSGTR